MTVDELIYKLEICNYTSYKDIPEAYKLAIQFTIDVLEELKQIAINRDFNDVAYDNLIYFKIQELKQYLDEKV